MIRQGWAIDDINWCLQILNKNCPGLDFGQQDMAHFGFTQRDIDEAVNTLAWLIQSLRNAGLVENSTANNPRDLALFALYHGIPLNFPNFERPQRPQPPADDNDERRIRKPNVRRKLIFEER